MADRTVENPGTEVPQMPEILERVLLYAIDEGKQKMETGDEPKNASPWPSIRCRERAGLQLMPSAMTVTLRPAKA